MWGHAEQTVYSELRGPLYPACMPRMVFTSSRTWEAKRQRAKQRLGVGRHTGALARRRGGGGAARLEGERSRAAESERRGHKQLVISRMMEFSPGPGAEQRAEAADGSWAAAHRSPSAAQLPAKPAASHNGGSDLRLSLSHPQSRTHNDGLTGVVENLTARVRPDATCSLVLGQILAKLPSPKAPLASSFGREALQGAQHHQPHEPQPCSKASSASFFLACAGSGFSHRPEPLPLGGSLPMALLVARKRGRRRACLTRSS